MRFPIKTSVVRIFQYTVIVLIIVQIFACKKGADDPFFSFHTRKARLSGSWNLKSAEWQKNDTSYIFNDSILIISNAIKTDTLPMQHTITFNKDNSYTEEINTDFPSDWKGNGEPAYTLTETYLGTWKFTGGGNVPAKSQLLLQVTQSSLVSSSSMSNVDATEYTDQPNGFVYDIQKLSKPELILSYNLVITYPGSTYTDNGSLNFTKD